MPAGNSPLHEGRKQQIDEQQTAGKRSCSPLGRSAWNAAGCDYCGLHSIARAKRPAQRRRASTQRTLGKAQKAEARRGTGRTAWICSPEFASASRVLSGAMTNELQRAF